MSSDKYYMELEAENKELKEELNKWDNPCGLGMMNKEATELYQELQKENKELKEENNKIKKEVEAYENTEYHDIQTITKLKEENKELKETILSRDEELGDITENVFPGYDDDIKELKEENEKLKEVVDYDGFKMQILETEVNNAMDYIDEAIERYSSPNPLVHKSTMLADFAELKKLLMN